MIAVLGFDIGEDVYQRLSLSEILLNLVSGKLVLVERSGDSVSLNILHGNLYFLRDVLDVEFVFFDIGQTYLKDSSL